MARSGNLNTPGTERKPGLGERVLTALVAEPGQVTLDELCDAINADNRQAVTAAMTRLITAKSARRIANGIYEATGRGRDRIKDGWRKSGPLGPLTGKRASNSNSFRQRIWKALRSMRKASTSDLVIMAVRGPEKDPMSSAQKYLNALSRGGFVHKRVDGGEARWFMLNDTGPIAPVHNPRTKKLRDPNTGETIDLGSNAASGQAGGAS